MKNLLLIVVSGILLIIIAAYVIGEASEKSGNAQASLAYARAHIVEVQNESRKDLMAGLMPYTVLGLGVLGVIAIAICVTAIIIVISLLVFAFLVSLSPLMNKQEGQYEQA